jgi:alkylation response protein AidB-like acyl-CoA dehydrogenase
MEAAGLYAAPHLLGADEPGDNALAIGPHHARGVADTYFNVRKTSIYGGSNEIQRNIIAKMVLGL